MRILSQRSRREPAAQARSGQAPAIRAASGQSPTARTTSGRGPSRRLRGPSRRLRGPSRRLRSTAAALVAAALISPAAATLPLPAPPAHAGPSDGMQVASRAHIDSPQVYWDQARDTFDLKTKVGEKPYPAATTVNWVGKGWSANTGKSQYQFTIPNKPGLEFLGKPGDTFYQAPVLPEGNHLPTWIGFGADTGFPQDRFRDATFSLDVLDVDGPGTFELFTSYEGKDRVIANRLMSSTENGLRSARLVEGDHTHNTTTFSRPGTYDITYRAVARDKNTGALIASKDTRFRWQVGGQEPAKQATPSLEDRYAQAPDGPVPAGYTFTAEPKQAKHKDGDDKLTTLSFSTGDTTASGTATILINGYHLTDVRVEKGQASWDEQIGPRTSDFQVVFTPDGAVPGKWISPALRYAPGQQRTAVDSAAGSAQLMAKINDPANTRLNTDDIALTDRGYDFSVKDNGNGTYTARIEMHDKAFRGYVAGGMQEKPSDDYPTEPFAGAFVNGVWEQTEDADLIKGAVARVQILPHPQVRALSGLISLDTPFGPGGLSASGELPDDTGAPQPTPSGDPTGTPSPTPTGNPTGTPSPTPTQPAAPVCTDGTKLLDHGHVDLTMRRADAGLEMKLHDDTGIHSPGAATEHALSDIAFGVRNSGRATRGPQQSGPAFDFLGKPGATYYALPFAQKRGLLWPGYNTQQIDYSQLNGPVTLSLLEAKTPAGAHFALAEQGGDFGTTPEVRLQSGTKKTSFPVTFATHAHPMWVFTAAGDYELKLQASAKTKDGAALKSQPQTLRVHVGAEAISTCLAGAPKPTGEPSGEPTATGTPSPSGGPTDSTDPTTGPSADPSASAQPTNTDSTGSGRSRDDDGSSNAGGSAGGSSGSAGSGSSSGGGSAGGAGHGAGAHQAGSLPRTGGSLMALGLAIPLLGAGGALLLISRRRRAVEA